VGSGDPIAEGLVSSLARPGGNVTGLAIIAGVDIVGKRLELLKEIVPGVTLVAMLWNPTNPSHVAALKEVPGFARSLRSGESSPWRRAGPRTSRALSSRCGRVASAGSSFWPTDSTFFMRSGSRASRWRDVCPPSTATRAFVKAGGLMAYQADFVPLFPALGTLVDKILKGTKPADIPVEQLTQVELTINLKTARRSA
jgi:putative ABC transport system substrate-binding protein